MEYKRIDDVGLDLHLWTPEDGASGALRPAVVFFFGGGWSGGSLGARERGGVQHRPRRIYAGGGSAGGHVAACTGIIAGLDEEGEDLSISSAPGNSCTLVGFEGMGHGFFNQGCGDAVAYEETVLAMLEFLREGD